MGLGGLGVNLGVKGLGRMEESPESSRWRNSGGLEQISYLPTPADVHAL